MTVGGQWVDTDRVPRIARVVAVGAPHHVTQRGNNRQQVFFSAADRRVYLSLLGSHCRRWKLTLLGYCLMPNHIHLVAVPEQGQSLAKAVGRTNYEYAVYLNGRRRRSGHVWQNRFYSTSLSRDHLAAALRYVDLNPVRVRLVVEAVSYEWSSAAAHVTGKDPTGLLDQEAWRELCPVNDWGEVLAAAAPEEQLAERLRQATRTGRPLGSPEFISALEARLQRTLTRQKPGPAPPKPLVTAAKMS